MNPTFTEEHGTFFLWMPEPTASNIKLVGQYKSEEELQERSITHFSLPALRKD